MRVFVFVCVCVCVCVCVWSTTSVGTEYHATYLLLLAGDRLGGILRKI